MTKSEIRDCAILSAIGLPIVAALVVYGIPAFCRLTIWVAQLTGQIPM